MAFFMSLCPYDYCILHMVHIMTKFLFSIVISLMFLIASIMISEGYWEQAGLLLFGILYFRKDLKDIYEGIVYSEQEDEE